MREMTRLYGAMQGKDGTLKEKKKRLRLKEMWVKNQMITRYWKNQSREINMTSLMKIHKWGGWETLTKPKGFGKRRKTIIEEILDKIKEERRKTSLRIKTEPNEWEDEIEMEWSSQEIMDINMGDYLTDWDEEQLHGKIWSAEEENGIQEITKTVKIKMQKEGGKIMGQIVEAEDREYWKLENIEIERVKSELKKIFETGTARKIYDELENFVIWGLITPMEMEQNQARGKTTTPYIMYCRMTEDAEKLNSEKLTGKEISRLQQWAREEKKTTPQKKPNQTSGNRS